MINNPTPSELHATLSSKPIRWKIFRCNRYQKVYLYITIFTLDIEAKILNTK